MVATTGAKLLPTDALTVMREKLLPQTTIVTPNIPEALLMWKEFSGATEQQQPPSSIDEFELFVIKLSQLVPEWVLVKGGHCPFTRDGKAAESEEEMHVVVDILYHRQTSTMIKFESPYQSTRHTHGTGCSLACQFPPYLPETSN